MIIILLGTVNPVSISAEWQLEGAGRAARRWHVAVERTFAYDRYYRECSECVQRSLRLAADHSESCDWSTHITSNSWPTFLATAVPFAPHSRSRSQGSRRECRVAVPAHARLSAPQPVVYLLFTFICHKSPIRFIFHRCDSYGGFSTIVRRFMTSTRITVCESVEWVAGV